jgi:hypothetical protein
MLKKSKPKRSFEQKVDGLGSVRPTKHMVCKGMLQVKMEGTGGKSSKKLDFAPRKVAVYADMLLVLRKRRTNLSLSGTRKKYELQRIVYFDAQKKDVSVYAQLPLEFSRADWASNVTLSSRLPSSDVIATSLSSPQVGSSSSSSSPSPPSSSDLRQRAFYLVVQEQEQQRQLMSASKSSRKSKQRAVGGAVSAEIESAIEAWAGGGADAATGDEQAQQRVVLISLAAATPMERALWLRALLDSDLKLGKVERAELERTIAPIDDDDAQDEEDGVFKRRSSRRLHRRSASLDKRKRKRKSAPVKVRVEPLRRRGGGDNKQGDDESASPRGPKSVVMKEDGTVVVVTPPDDAARGDQLLESSKRLLAKVATFEAKHGQVELALATAATTSAAGFHSDGESKPKAKVQFKSSTLTTSDKRQQLANMKMSYAQDLTSINDNVSAESSDAEKEELLRTAYSAAINLWQSHRQVRLLAEQHSGDARERPSLAPPSIASKPPKRKRNKKAKAKAASAASEERRGVLMRQNTVAARQMLKHIDEAKSSDADTEESKAHPDAGTLYEAVHEYARSGHRDDVLNFSPGAIITMIRPISDEWAIGRYEGQRGIFPLPYTRQFVTTDLYAAAAEVNLDDSLSNLESNSLSDLRDLLNAVAQLESEQGESGAKEENVENKEIEANDDKEEEEAAAAAEEDDDDASLSDEKSSSDDEESMSDDEDSSSLSSEEDEEEEIGEDLKEIRAFEKDAGEIAGWLELEIRRQNQNPRAIKNARTLSDHLRAKAVPFLEKFANHPGAVPAIVRVHEALARYDREIEGAQERFGLSTSRYDLRKLAKRSQDDDSATVASISSKSRRPSSSSKNALDDSDDDSDSSYSSYSDDSDDDMYEPDFASTPFLSIDDI